MKLETNSMMILIKKRIKILLLSRPLNKMIFYHNNLTHLKKSTLIFLKKSMKFKKKLIMRSYNKKKRRTKTYPSLMTSVKT